MNQRVVDPHPTRCAAPHRPRPKVCETWGMTTLFDPIRLGELTLRNRVVMAPLTRNRADAPGQVPTALMAQYYAQRAQGPDGAGLIVSEGTPVSADGHGYLNTPGMHTDAQAQGWRRVTDAVHAQGGSIVAQLWHVGRISHTSVLPNGSAPVSSTARAATSKTFTAAGFESVSTPRALATHEVPRIVEDFRQAARRARQAGFDGVEIHGANGYLIEQFLRDSLNDRRDEWGGTATQRVRFAVAVAQAVASEIGAGRTGIRLSPVTPANDAAQDSDAQGTYGLLMQQLAPLKLAFIHVIEGSTGGPRDHAPFDYQALREIYRRNHPDGGWIVNNGYTRDMALDVVAQGHADAVAFGRPFISNPDLVARLRHNVPLNAADRKTFYGGDGQGYVDYPRAS